MTTSEFAKQLGIKPQTLHSSLCRNGSYYGITPLKMPNGQLRWPDDAFETLVKGAVK